MHRSTKAALFLGCALGVYVVWYATETHELVLRGGKNRGGKEGAADGRKAPGPKLKGKPSAVTVEVTGPKRRPATPAERKQLGSGVR